MMTVHVVKDPKEGLDAVWKDRPDVLATRALAVLEYIGKAAAEAGPAGYSADCTRAIGWSIRAMVRTLGKAARAEDREAEMSHGFGWIGNHPSDRITEAGNWIRIVHEHFARSDVAEWTPTEEENAGLALVAEIALGHLEVAAQLMRPEAAEVSHAAE